MMTLGVCPVRLISIWETGGADDGVDRGASSTLMQDIATG